MRNIEICRKCTIEWLKECYPHWKLDSMCCVAEFENHTDVLFMIVEEWTDEPVEHSMVCPTCKYELEHIVTTQNEDL